MRKWSSYFVVAIIFINVVWIVFHAVNLFTIVQNRHASDVDIKLEGNRFIELGINQEYVEEGGIAYFDNKEYPLEIAGEVNTMVPGTYLLKYHTSLKNVFGYNAYRVVKVVDKAPPVLKLNGASKMTITVGSKYEELGVQVTDDSGEDLSSKVKISGTVNTKKAGVYVITYSVSDSSSNEAKITREVTVKEKKVMVTTTNNEKGNTSTGSVDLKKDPNTTIAMSFTSDGIHIEGYVKQGSGTYSVKLCKDGMCSSTKMTTKKNYYYSGDIKLTSLVNGTYQMKVSSGNDMDIINRLEYSERIVRAKVGDKLVTINYKNDKPTITIANFAYEYDILIDAGHGGEDSGAVNSKMLEKNLNLTQSLYEKKRYEQHGLKVKMIRTDDTYGIMMGPSDEALVRRRAYAIGYYGAVSKYVYSNHHNSMDSSKYTGWEMILPAKATKNELAVSYQIANAWKTAYPVKEDHTRIYTRDYDTGEILSRSSGKTYNVRNWYAIIRLSYELYHVNTVLYEGCYLSNMSDYNWYMNNWKKLSEIKIKAYVESLGKTYIPV